MGSIIDSSLPPARAIPVTFRESLTSWWYVGQKGSAASEERLLRRLPFPYIKDGTTTIPPPPIAARSSTVQLSNPAHYINTLSFLPATTANNAPPAVLLHGYGAGLGFFFQNLPTLGNWAERRQTPVYALDWLGMGRSARVPFKVRAKKTDIEGRVREAESFFVESLEEWREKMGVEKMTLIGHSLGAYLSAVYALRYPDRVSRLVLLSPAGVPHDPNGTTQPSRELDAAPTPPSSSPPSPSSSSLSVRADATAVHKLKAEQKVEKQRESNLRRLATHLWEQGWSPFQVVRSTLFWGPMLVGKYSSRRFTGLSDEETRNIHDYILHITLAKGSGEYCISHILAPGAHARMPLVDRVADLKIPVVFVYGEHDWMDPVGGLKAVENLRAAGNDNAETVIIPGAGHHVYLDNPTAVNELLVKELDQTIGV
ncbi:alpha/beta-hydrolase [Hysterangium stoloniferum]|nr:alpha/beta-hydrolase [Hysterangium stoloniferum]